MFRTNLYTVLFLIQGSRDNLETYFFHSEKVFRKKQQCIYIFGTLFCCGNSEGGGSDDGNDDNDDGGNGCYDN